MKDSLIFEHKKYISAKRASELVGYTRDYVGQLSRAGKIDSRMVGRVWFISEESILKHKSLNALNNKKAVNLPSSTIGKSIDSKVSDYKPLESVLPIVKTTPSPLINTASNIDSPATFTHEAIKPIKSVINNFSLVANTLPLLSAGTHQISFASNVNTNGSLNFATLKNNSFKFNTKESFAMTFIALVIVLNFFFIKDNFLQNKNKLTISNSEALSIESIHTIASSISKALGVVSDRIALIFNINKNLNFSKGGNKSVVASSDKLPNTIFEGIAVTPSSNTQNQDEEIKQHIRENFSDEVKVSPDSSGTAGIITPVFKKASKDSYVYVLVPTVSEKK